MRVPNGKIEAEALCHEKLQLKDVCRFCSGDMGGVRVQRDRVICRFGREEQGG